MSSGKALTISLDAQASPGTQGWEEHSPSWPAAYDLVHKHRIPCKQLTGNTGLSFAAEGPQSAQPEVAFK